MKKELRKLDINAEVRAEEGDGVKRLRGVIPYNTLSVELWGEYEVIAPTAFNKTLKDGTIVHALVAHDDRLILGSTRNGTLRLASGEDGLHTEIDLPDTTYAKDAWEIIRRGDVTTMSFGFYPVKVREDWDAERQKKINYLEEVRLIEVSFLVMFPAYPDTTSLARSMRGIDMEKFAEAFEADRPTHEQTDLLREVGEIIGSRIEPQPASTTEAAQSTSAGDFLAALVEAARNL